MSIVWYQISDHFCDLVIFIWFYHVFLISLGPTISATDIVPLLCQAGLFDRAFAVALAFKLDLGPIFEGVAAKWVDLNFDICWLKTRCRVKYWQLWLRSCRQSPAIPPYPSKWVWDCDTSSISKFKFECCFSLIYFVFECQNRGFLRFDVNCVSLLDADTARGR